MARFTSVRRHLDNLAAQGGVATGKWLTHVHWGVESQKPGRTRNGVARVRTPVTQIQSVIKKDSRVTQPVAFVTGADRGLGSALVTGLLEQGWWVFAGQHRPDWPELGALAARFPDALHIVPLEVASLESAQAAAQAVA